MTDPSNYSERRDIDFDPDELAPMRGFMYGLLFSVLLVAAATMLILFAWSL